MSTMTPMRSVTRSATTMGAVRGIGHAVRSKRMSDLKTSPTLPGVTVSTKPERNVRKLSPFGDAADLEQREVVLPLEEAEDVVAEREAARRAEGPDERGRDGRDGRHGGASGQRSRCRRFADAPLKSGTGIGVAYENSRPAPRLQHNARRRRAIRRESLLRVAARRHMIKYGTTSEELGAIAVSTRAWATLNPLAQMRKPITIDDHQASRMIADRCACRRLRSVQRRSRGDRDQCRRSSRPGKPACAYPRMGTGPPLIPHGAREPVRARHWRRTVWTGRPTDGRREDRRGKHPGDLRLLHLHDAGVARGLRGVCEGRRRSARGKRRARSGGSLPTSTGGGIPATTCGA